MTPEQRREYNRNHRAKYVEENRLSARTQQREKRDWVNKQKAKPCADCGIQYPYYVMDFDHIAGEKAFNMGSVGTRSMKSLKEEVLKCEVVCANCHRERTYRRKNGYGMGT